MENLSKLEQGMKKNDVVELLGEPIDDIGSGLSIYLYRIEDSTLTLNFDSEDKLFNAVLEKEDGSKIEILEQ